ncbi:MAG: carbon starvation CstA 5TM domain-containing protein, partial [Myxococcota bacterium]
QLLAALSLTLVTVWLYRSGRPWLVVGVPMAVVLVVAGLAMALQLGQFVEQDKYLLAALGAIILALEAWVVLEAIAAVRRIRSGQPTRVQVIH